MLLIKLPLEKGHHTTPEVTTLISYNNSDLRDTIPCQGSPLPFPTQSVPSETEDCSRGGKYPKYVPLPTCLDYSQTF